MFGKFASLHEAYGRVRQAGADPFGVAFDEVVSPTTARIGGRDILLLGTNNYLGLTFAPEAIAAASDALHRYGTGTTGSRIANGTYAGHAELERRVARFLGRRDAMVFTTGHQANLGILATLAGREDHLLLDADSHASIYDGARLGSASVTRFRHNDPGDLARRLRVLADKPGDRLIVVEGLYSMLGDVAPLREIAAIKRETGGGVNGVLVTAVSEKAFEQAIGVVARGGTVAFNGLPPGDFPLNIFGLVLNGITVRGSIVGTRLDLQESIDFATQGKVRAHIEKAKLDDINTIFERMHKGKIQGRVVMDLTAS